MKTNINGQEAIITLTNGEIINCRYYGCCEDGVVMIDQYKKGISILREIEKTQIANIEY